MKRGIQNIWLSSEIMFAYDNKLWFSEMDSNEIYYYDTDTKICTLLCTINEEPQNGKRLFGAMTISEGFLYLFPFSAQSAYKINIFTGQFESIKLKQPEKGFYENYSEHTKFTTAFSYENRIFAVGCTYPAIIEYIIDTGEILYHNEWLFEIETHVKKANVNAIFNKAIVVDSKIYAPFCRGNAVLVYDMSKGNYKVCMVENIEDGFISLCFDGDEFWFLSLDNHSIIKWNEKKNQSTIYSEFPKRLNVQSFREIIYWENSIILLPEKANMFLELDKDTGEIQELNKELRNIRKVIHCKGENALYLFSIQEALLIMFYESSQHFQTARIEKESNQLGDKTVINAIIEGKRDALDSYVAFISEKSCSQDTLDTKLSFFGEQIWLQVSKNS